MMVTLWKQSYRDVKDSVSEELQVPHTRTTKKGTCEM